MTEEAGEVLGEATCTRCGVARPDVNYLWACCGDGPGYGDAIKPEKLACVERQLASERAGRERAERLHEALVKCVEHTYGYPLLSDPDEKRCSLEAARDCMLEYEKLRDASTPAPPSEGPKLPTVSDASQGGEGTFMVDQSSYDKGVYDAMHGQLLGYSCGYPNCERCNRAPSEGPKWPSDPTCPNCKGSCFEDGNTNQVTCRKCGGRGRIPSEGPASPVAEGEEEEVHFLLLEQAFLLLEQAHRATPRFRRSAIVNSALDALDALRSQQTPTGEDRGKLPGAHPGNIWPRKKDSSPADNAAAHGPEAKAQTGLSRDVAPVVENTGQPPSPVAPAAEGKRCCVCKSPTTGECDHEGQFVCGFPLCANCEHYENERGFGAHRRKVTPVATAYAEAQEWAGEPPPASPPARIPLREPTQSKMPPGGIPLLDCQPASDAGGERQACANCHGPLPEPMQVYVLARPNALGLKFCRKNCARVWQDHNPMPAEQPPPSGQGPTEALAMLQAVLKKTRELKPGSDAWCRRVEAALGLLADELAKGGGK